MGARRQAARRHVESRRGPIGLSQDDGKKGRDRVKGVGVRLYIEAAGSIDDAAARAVAAGISLSKAPHDTEWGARAFEVTEPSGFLLTIASRPADTT